MRFNSLLNCVVEGCGPPISSTLSKRIWKEMDLTFYHRFGGLNLLSSAMTNHHCNLETLRLNNCGLTDEGCDALASALKSNLSHLGELDLSGNKIGDIGMMMLRAGLQNDFSKLGTLKLKDCGITYEGCGTLASVLASNASHLRELDLSMNTLSHLEIMLLSAGLGNPSCKLEKLKLVNCSFTDGSCDALMAALRSNPSHLRKLDLSKNTLGYLEMMLLSAAMENPYWTLETLKLNDCNLTD
ncbi:NACHT, LRR and PYD domains-containing protein 12-like isoform X3 [Pseudorasbora parva]|uniref:NACHT, LRR and PYD domains-containing protein 12-like isoform X3 n=1 Tax=Pseudorasbora parva TaxID=51549 RepID=UPI00351EBF8E